MARQSTVKKALEMESLRKQGYPEPRLVLLEDEPDIPDSSADAAAPLDSARAWWKRPLRLAIAASVIAAVSGIWLTHAYFRKNAAIVEPGLRLQHQIAVRDAAHNTNTDFIYWRGRFYLIHAARPAGFAEGESRLALLSRAPEDHTWNPVADFQPPPGGNFRGASFAAIGSRLFVYAVTAAPNEGTLVSCTDNGRDWSDLEQLENGAAVSRPKTRDALAWYATAGRDGTTMLLRSPDGVTWEEVSEVHRGGNCEVDIEFLPDGRMIAVAAVTPPGSIFARAGHTLVATAFPPYTSWQTVRAHESRLGSPCLFRHRGELYAIARSFDDFGASRSRLSDAFSRQRSAIYRVTPDSIEWITDLPSSGDTAGAAVVVQGDRALGSYFSSDVARDWPRFLGRMLPTEIHTFELELASLM